MIDADSHPDTSDADHGDEAVPEDRGGSIGVDSRFGHEVEQEVDGCCAEQPDAVDV